MTAWRVICPREHIIDAVKVIRFAGRATKLVCPACHETVLLALLGQRLTRQQRAELERANDEVDGEWRTT